MRGKEIKRFSIWCRYFWMIFGPFLSRTLSIFNTVKMIEGYVLFSRIGCSQMLYFKYEGIIRVYNYRYICTFSCQIISKASMLKRLNRNMFCFMVEYRAI